MIRDATPNAFAAIRQVSSLDEKADAVERLHADGDVWVELVTRQTSAVAGHVLYSRLAIERDGSAADFRD